MKLLDSALTVLTTLAIAAAPVAARTPSPTELYPNGVEKVKLAGWVGEAPDHVTEALNSANWGPGKTVTFSHVHDCQWWPDSRYWDCTAGYVTVVSPAENRTCALRRVTWYPYNNKISSSRNRELCRYH